MKVYLFDTNNGIFAGETFEEPDMIQYEEGMTPIPPPEYGLGQVPVFDHRNNEWALIPMAVAKQLLKGAVPEPAENRR